MMIANLIQDLRYSLRQLRKTLGLYDYRGADAGTGDWGECRDLHVGACGAAEEPAGDRP